jgi:hypothetical protein
MTEANTTTTTTTEARCRWGSSTDNPCWRPAVEEDPGSEAWVCEWHAELAEATKREGAWLSALEATRGFVEGETNKRGTSGEFAELAYTFRDAVTERAAEAAINARVAEVLANQGPDDQGPEEEMMRRHGAHLLVRSDAMTNSLAILDGEREPDEPERLVAYASVRYAVGLVGKEDERFRKQQGLA